MNACLRRYRVTSSVAFAIALFATVQDSRAERDEDDAAAHTGTTWRVANNGVDSADCGSRQRPCRTITQGIENAARGDLVLVGPGLYGDVDGSCEFPQTADADEEFGFQVCADVPNTNPSGARICLNKAVTVASVAGAESTIVDACGSSFAVVVFGSDSRFGLPQRGFTLLNSTGAAVSVSAPSNVTVGGNIAVPASGAGFQLESGMNHRLVGNLARNASRGFIAVNASPTSGLRMTDNVAVSNLTGFFLLSENVLVVRRNVATGNDVGFTLSGSGHILRQNSAVGNRNYGILIEHAVADGPPIAVTQNNIFGNNKVALAGNVNCGVLNETEAVVAATNNFWGAATGPGANPADDACDVGGGQIIHDPFAPRQFALSRKPGSSQSSSFENDEERDTRAQ